MEGRKMKKDFVIFFSPGTFVAEQTQKEIDSWDIEKAKEMARSIKERYGATPYGFCFTTRERKDDELDSKEIKRSGMYFLGGKVLTVGDLKERNDPKDGILISNMEINKIEKIVENCNSWKWVQELREGDKIIGGSK
jgi:hypothetical protein